MALLPVGGIIARRCGKADIRALLGKGGGHEVVVFGKPELWKDVFGVSVTSEASGGTSISIASEPGKTNPFTLHAYYTQGYRDEVRVAAPRILDAHTDVADRAARNKAALDPDVKGGPKDELVVFLVKTPDGNYHLRAQLASKLKPPVSKWTANANSWGSKFGSGIVLGDIERQVWESLLQHKNVLLFGPPGTGKTRLMLRIRQAFQEGLMQIGFDPTDLEDPFKFRETEKLPKNRKAEFVTFHQSLTYETFILGLRPTQGSGGALQFAVRDGIFLNLAAHALTEDSAALLLIDELNRGNVADIFGELITVLEADKRLNQKFEQSPGTVTVTLPLEPENPSKNTRIKQRFQMPYYFYTLASMNSLDRSVAPLDSAMRRRFRIIKLSPRLDVVEENLLQGQKALDELADPSNPTRIEVGSLAISLWQKLNEGIGRDWGPEYLLGHSYILDVTDSKKLIDAFSESILPQVFELYRDRPADLAVLLNVEEAGNANSIVVRRGETDPFSIGLVQAAPLEMCDLQRLTAEDTIKRLYFLAHGKKWGAVAPPIANTTNPQ